MLIVLRTALIYVIRRGYVRRLSIAQVFAICVAFYIVDIFYRLLRPGSRRAYGLESWRRRP